MTMFDGWDPEKYNQFSTEREQPFWDLVRLLKSVDSPKVVDLGCGDGRLTAALSESVRSPSVLGIDSSNAMIAAAAEHTSEHVRFEVGDIGAWKQADSYDLVFANASMQWVPDHPSLLTRWSESLRPGGQLAIQVPANADHPAHLVAAELAEELMGNPPPDVVAQNVLAPERYAELLDALGFDRQHVRLQVYVHHLSSSADVVEWVKGTTLTRFKEPFGAAGWDRFIDLYQERLLAVLGDQSPYVYPFKRILIWGQRN
jgi:trans-aconitate 2-methyltransferase